MNRTLLVMLASLLFAAPAAAADLETVRITHAIGSFESLPIAYARAAGYFADEGLTVVSVPSLGTGQDLAVLDTGDVQFNLGDGAHQIGAIIANRPILDVYNVFRRSLTGLVISVEVAKRSGIAAGAPLADRIRALKGLKIGVGRSGSLVERQLRHLLRISGAEGDVEIVPLGKPPDLLVALENRAVDGLAVRIPYDRTAVTRGLAVMWIDMAVGSARSIDPLVMDSLVTSPEFAERHPDTVRAMIRALHRAVEDIGSERPEEVRDTVLPEFGKMSPAVLLSGIEALRPALNVTGVVTHAMAENTVRLDRRNGVTADQLFAVYSGSYQ